MTARRARQASRCRLAPSPPPSLSLRSLLRSRSRSLQKQKTPAQNARTPERCGSKDLGQLACRGRGRAACPCRIPAKRSARAPANANAENPRRAEAAKAEPKSRAGARCTHRSPPRELRLSVSVRPLSLLSESRGRPLSRRSESRGRSRSPPLRVTSRPPRDSPPLDALGALPAEYGSLRHAQRVSSAVRPAAMPRRPALTVPSTAGSGLAPRRGCPPDHPQAGVVSSS
jgi:hypothetical protein